MVFTHSALQRKLQANTSESVELSTEPIAQLSISIIYDIILILCILSYSDSLQSKNLEQILFIFTYIYHNMYGKRIYSFNILRAKIEIDYHCITIYYIHYFPSLCFITSAATTRCSFSLLHTHTVCQWNSDRNAVNLSMRHTCF